MNKRNICNNKMLAVNDFKQFDPDNMPVSFSNLISELIRSATDMYVYRTHKYTYLEDEFIKWLKNDRNVRLYNQITIYYLKQNMKEVYTPESKEKVYRLALDRLNKGRPIGYFEKLIINSIQYYRATIANKLTKEAIFKKNILLDQHDFVLAAGPKILFWTDLHCFQFFICDEHTEKMQMNLNKANQNEYYSPDTSLRIG